MIDLVDPACIGQILNLAREFEAHYGIPTGLIIIDTVAKGIAATDGDEDKARYQNRVAANMKRVHDELPGVHIAGIGHTGKDESRGERGSNARLADVDVAVQISGDDVKTATVIAANDQASGPLTAFATERVAMGLDEDGDEFEIHILAATVSRRGESPRRRPGGAGRSERSATPLTRRSSRQGAITAQAGMARWSRRPMSRSSGGSTRNALSAGATGIVQPPNAWRGSVILTRR
jgi:hypothetical protein